MTDVLHVITGLDLGGAERSLHMLLGGARRQSHAVVSLSSAGTYGPRIEALGVPLTVLDMPRGAVTPQGLRRLRARLRADPPKVIHGWMYHGNLAASLSRRLAGTRPRLAWNIRQSMGIRSEVGLKTRATIEAGRWLAAGPEAIVYNSAVARGEHEAAGYPSGSGLVIPNGFDTDLWRRDAAAGGALRARLGIAADAPVIGFVGRHHGIKDLPTLLRAMRTVLEAHAGAHLVLVGKDNGPQSPDLAPLYAALPADRVHAVGEQAEMPRWFSLFDLLALSSVSEGFPNVLGEAMACGVPCVSTDAGDAAHVVGGTGRIVPRRAPDALARALLEMLALPAQARSALGAEARSRISETFSLAATIARYEDLYDRLLA